MSKSTRAARPQTLAAQLAAVQTHLPAKAETAADLKAAIEEACGAAAGAARAAIEGYTMALKLAAQLAEQFGDVGALGFVAGSIRSSLSGGSAKRFVEFVTYVCDGEVKFRPDLSAYKPTTAAGDRSVFTTLGATADGWAAFKPAVDGGEAKMLADVERWLKKVAECDDPAKWSSRAIDGAKAALAALTRFEESGE